MMIKIVSVFLVFGLLFTGCIQQKPPTEGDGIPNEVVELEDGEIETKEFYQVDQITENIPKEDINQLSNNLEIWGPGKRVNELNQPIDPLELEEKFKEFDCKFIDAGEEKNITLTFDNGYENGYTTKILDTLKEHQVSAVFFLTYDYVKSVPELVKRMIEEGHVIGNHTYYHSSMPSVSMDKAKQNIEKMHQYMVDNFDYEMTLFRFPKGEFSKRTLALAESYGYETLFWSFAYKDWEENNQMGATKALETVKKGLHPGAIYLLHSVSKDNTEILGDFISHAKSEGYQFISYA